MQASSHGLIPSPRNRHTAVPQGRLSLPAPFAGPADVLLDDTIVTAHSATTNRPCKFGYTSTGKHIIVVWDELSDDPRMIYPVTSYEVPEPQ